ncbi:MAG TPA: TatD family hydrolase [Desulfosarcina sp.]|nr:TatD family hydrolase [Desulfosarcina sp.]
MKIFDSHCHLDDHVFEADFRAVLDRAAGAAVRRMMVAGIDWDTSRRAVDLADGHAQLYASVGVHPHDARACSEDTLARLQNLAAHPKVVAWGETGLDYNRMHSPRKDQERWFRRQLEIAEALDLPLILHERDSGGRLLEILRSVPASCRTGVVHCFSGTATELEHYLEMDLHIGITGIVTLSQRGASLRGMIPTIPADRLLVETDAPYLTPTPLRNRYRRNEPAFVREVLIKVAEVRGDDPAALAEQIWANTCRLFRIDLPADRQTASPADRPPS